MPRWNPINICSYHLQEAGATPVQEIAYALSHRDRRARLGARLRPGAGRAVRRGGRPDLLLRQRGRPLRRGDVQDARLHASSGTSSPRERYGVAGPRAAPVPLRRAGQLPGPDRGAAGEQRAADRAGDARRHAVARTPGPARCSCRPGTRRSACRGRGTSSGRCGCSRCWPSRPTCWSTTTCSPGRSSSRARSPSSSQGARAEIDRVQEMGGAVAAVESGYMKGALVGSLAERRRRIEERGGRRRRGQPVRHHRAQPAARRPRRRDHDGRPGRRGRRPARRSGPGGPTATPPRCDDGAATRCATAAGTDAQPDDRHPRLRPRRRDDGGVGRRAARGVR